MKRYHYLIVPVFVALGLLSGCTDNEFPIFYYLEQEAEQTDNSLDNTLSITAMGKAAEYYFISAGGSIYTRLHYDNIEKWQTVRFPAKAEFNTAMTISSVTGGDVIYACFLMDDGTYKLFEGDPNKNPTWNEIVDAKAGGKQIIRLEALQKGHATDEQLLAITLYQGDYGLHYSDMGPVAFKNALTNQAAVIKNVTYNSPATEFWLITSSKIFTFTGSTIAGDGDVFTEKTADKPNVNGGYMGIKWLGAPYSSYYVSTQGGVVHSSADGTTWTASGTKSVGGEDVPFTFFAAVPADSYENILVGTVGFGFYEMREGTVSGLTRLGEFTANELYYGWVADIFIDEQKVFCLTAGSGLWRNVYESGSWGTWVWE